MTKSTPPRDTTQRRIRLAAKAAEAGDYVEVVRLLAPRFNPKRAQKALSLGLAAAYLKLGNLEMALQVAEALDARHGPTYEISYLLGQIYEGRGHYEAATQAYREALDREPEDVEPRVRLAEMSLRVMDISAARRWTRINDLGSILDPRLHLMRGLALRADGLFMEALREVQLAKDSGLHDERIPPALHDLRDSVAEQERHLEELSQYLGDNFESLPPGLAHADFAEDYVTCLMNLGRRAQALRYVSDACVRFPVDPGIQALRARVLLDSGYYEEAAHSAVRVGELEGDDSFLDWCRDQIDGLVGGPEERYQDFMTRAGVTDPPTRARLLANAALLQTTSPMEIAGRALAAQAIEADPDCRIARLVAAHLDQTHEDFSQAVAKFRYATQRWPRAETYASLGVAYMAMGDLAEAYNAFRKALELSPDFDVPHIQLAVLAINGGRYERATRECRLALDANPSSALARQVMVECFLRLGRYDDAEELCHQLLDLPNANGADAYRALGNVWEARGDVNRAIDCYSEAVNDGAGDLRLLLDIGRLYARHGQHEEAEKFLQRALTSSESHPAALDALGELFMARGEIDDAVASFRKATEEAPDAFDPLYHLARALMRQGEWAEAHERLAETLRLRPHSAGALAAQAVTLRRLGRLGEAVKAFRDGLKCDPENYELLDGLADLYFAEPQGKWVTGVEARRCLRNALGCAQDPGQVTRTLGRLEAVQSDPALAERLSPVAPVAPAPRERGPLAPLPHPKAWAEGHYRRRSEETNGRAEHPARSERLLTRVIQLGDGSPEPFLQRATVRAELGRYAEAIPDLTEAIRLDPKRAEAFFERGALRHALGDTEGALADFDRAIELRHRNAISHERRGFVYLELDRPQDAASDFTSALAMGEESVTARWGRARALLAVNQPGLAADDLTEALGVGKARAELHNDRGECYRRLGAQDAAARDFSAAVKLSRRFTQALENRARLSLTLGRAGAALKDIERALEQHPDDAELTALREEARRLRGDS